MGNVYWLTGLSGAGKSTVGKTLCKILKERGVQALLLDGDELIKVLGNNVEAYTIDSRKKRAFQYAKLCRMLGAQGITVVCCTISMFDEVRAWNRENIPGYYEVFINVDYKTLKARDNGRLYTMHKTAMVGSNPRTVELPKNPDLIIRNTYQNNVNEYAEMILSKSHNVGLGKGYWNSYYATQRSFMQPSDFAQYALRYMEGKGKLFDMGCGNGRDSIYYDSYGIRVTAMDISEEAIKLVKSRESNVFTICDDFTISNAMACNDFDYYYLRWSLHTISYDKQLETFRRISSAAKPRSLIFIEARSVNDDLYGIGAPVERNAFIHGHYRRFLDVNETRRVIEEFGFHIIHISEDRGYSKYGNDDPVLMRLVAKKGIS